MYSNVGEKRMRTDLKQISVIVRELQGKNALPMAIDVSRSHVLEFKKDELCQTENIPRLLGISFLVHSNIAHAKFLLQQ